MICEINGPLLTGTWNANDDIVFDIALNLRPLFRVKASGGTAEPLTKLDEARKESSHWGPSFLPDGRHYLFAASGEGPAAFVGELGSDTRTPLPNIATAPQYSDGHLVYVRNGVLVAQPFDLDRLQVSGAAVALGSGGVLLGDSSYSTGASNLPSAIPVSVSNTGALAFRAGGSTGNTILTWVDRSGKNN